MEIQDIAIVLDFKTYIHSTRRKDFTLVQLINYFFETPFGKTKKTKEAVTALVRTECSNPSKPLSYVVPVRRAPSAAEWRSARYMFLEDYIRSCATGSRVMNTRRMTEYFPRQLPVFYSKEFQKHRLLGQPMALIEKLIKTFQVANASLLYQEKDNPDFAAIAPKIVLTEQFIMYTHLLPFVDPESIIADKTRARQFFTQLFNIMRVHILAEHYKTSGLKNSEDWQNVIYEQYHYNIAGENYSLNDIRYMILGYGQAKPSANTKSSFLSAFLCSKRKVHVQKSQPLTDYKSRLVCGRSDSSMDPRLLSGSPLSSLADFLEHEPMRLLCQSEPSFGSPDISSIHSNVLQNRAKLKSRIHELMSKTGA